MPALVVVHSEPISNVYKAHFCSAANFWKNISSLLIVVISLVATFASQGLWKKTNTYLEQPIIEFNRRCTFVLRDNSNNADRYYFWSSFEEFNQLAQYQTAVNLEAERMLVPVITSEEIDYNGDHRTDELLVDVALRLPPIADPFNVYHVFYALEVKVKLECRALVETSGWIIGSVEHLHPGQALRVWGDLQFLQKRPLPSYGLQNDSNSANDSASAVEDMFSGLDFHLVNFFPMEIQRRNFESNFSVDLLGKVENWLPSFTSNSNSSSQQEFTTNFHIKIREQNLVYQTDAFELLKWAWIQYFAILIIVRYAINCLSAFLYENRILGTVFVGCEGKIKTY